MPDRNEIPRPGRLEHVPEPAPHAPLRGMPDWPGRPLESEPEPVEVESTGYFDDLLAAAQDVARDDARVRDHLEGHAHALIGASVLDGGKDDVRGSAVVVIYDYERNATVEVTLGGEGRQLEVVGVEDVDYHPAPSEEEVSKATEIARGDRRVAGHLAEELESTAILVSDVEQGDRHHGSRRIEIGFGHPEERLPRVRALVDLAQGRVLGVRADHSHHDDEPEVPR